VIVRRHAGETEQKLAVTVSDSSTAEGYAV
jgi:hypothetical protein